MSPRRSLQPFVRGKNILVSGGTSTGKTTFLNALMREIPPDERLILIEDTPELQLRHANAVALLAARSELGEARVTANDLVSASLRMRPDRIILGELRGAEACAFLRAQYRASGFDDDDPCQQHDWCDRADGPTGWPGGHAAQSSGYTGICEEYDRRVRAAGTRRRHEARCRDDGRLMAYSLPATTSLTEPSGTQAVTDAASWLQGTMLGSVATIIAVLAIAAVDVGLFSGRLNVRRGPTVVMGCCVLFGSGVIANALMALIDTPAPDGMVIAAEALPSPLDALPKSQAVPYDPYAGASVVR